MVLHMLYSSQQVDACLALLSERDSLLVMDPSIIMAESWRFEGLPCPVSVLREPDSASSDVSVNVMTVEQISVAEWVELVCVHTHNMAWS